MFGSPPRRTPFPIASGEGRFAAEDFLREIQALSARFDVIGSTATTTDTVDSRMLQSRC